MGHHILCVATPGERRGPLRVKEAKLLQGGDTRCGLRQRLATHLAFSPSSLTSGGLRLSQPGTTDVQGWVILCMVGGGGFCALWELQQHPWHLPTRCQLHLTPQL